MGQEVGKEKNRSRTHGPKRLRKVGATARVESFGDEASLGKDAFKQGRINSIDTNDDITLENDKKQGKKGSKCSIPINRGLIQAIPTSLLHSQLDRRQRLRNTLNYVWIKSLLNAARITTAHTEYKVNVAEGVNAASEEVSTAELLKEFDLLKWDQQVVSELVALRNFARRYGSRFCTHGGCIQSSHAQTG
ncbi:hypothetical protein Tco_0639083 [Tanacetum coccineum]